MQRARFEELTPGLRDASLQLLRAQGFETATPVQCSTIPLLTTNKDVAVEACTGSGKTLAFVLPVVEVLARMESPLSKHQVGAVIVSPTRELAKQIFEVAQPYLLGVCAAGPMLLVGGSNPQDDVLKFKQDGANVLVGTPGRLDDIMGRSKEMSLKLLEILILDEADRLLGMGFERQLSAIMVRLPKQRRTGLFSATQTEAVEELARAGLRNAVRVTVHQSISNNNNKKSHQDGATLGTKTPTSLKMEYALYETDEKLASLVSFLKHQANHKVIVYFLTCACVDFFHALMPRLPGVSKVLKLFSLHGRMKQSVRELTLASFAATKQGGVLLCTDLAARGLDIPDVDWVVQYDPPQDPSAFVHRVGRTARMGRSGSALLYLLPHEEPYVEFLRRRQVLLHLSTALPANCHSPQELCALARSLAEKDRDILEKGTRAFVSTVRAYKEHQCNFIFRLPQLDLGRLATSFGLLSLPRMKEVKQSKVPIKFKPSNVNPDSVKFKDKNREKQRQTQLKMKAQRDKEQAEAAAEVEAQEKRACQKNRESRDALHLKKTAQKRRLDQDRRDTEELGKEYRLLKKLRRKEISEAEYDEAIEELDESHVDISVTSKKGNKKKKRAHTKVQT